MARKFFDGKGIEHAPAGQYYYPRKIFKSGLGKAETTETNFTESPPYASTTHSRDYKTKSHKPEMADRAFGAYL
jgi:hypothetical protein